MRKEKFIPLSLFLLYLLVGLNSFSDYGVSWDEPISRANGIVNVKYILERFAPFMLSGEIKGSPNLVEWHDRDYGVAFEVPLVVLEKLLHLSGTRNIFLFRHLVTFLFSALGVLAVYGLAMIRFKDYRYGLLAALLIITSPRFFAESFYNSKDIVFMFAFVISMYTMVKFLVKPSCWMALIHGLVAAYATDIRIMGVMLAVGTITCMVIRAIKKECQLGFSLLLIALYLFSYVFFTVAFFPWLWLAPLDNILLVFKNMAIFRWDYEILYLGERIRSIDIPWHYVPTYIAVTTPIPYMLFFITGGLATVSKVVKRIFTFWQDDDEMQDFIYLAVFTVPILAVIVMNSVVYDGWRQLYFIYPSFVLLTTLGVKLVFDMCKKYNVLTVVLKLALFFVLVFNVHWIYSEHPHQNVYFNSFVGSDWRKKFDLDYWGLSNTQALRAILSKDLSPIINVWADSFTSLDIARLALTDTEIARLRLSRETNNPLYVLNNYRQSEDMDGTAYHAQFDVFGEIRVDNEIILTIYKFRSR